MRFLLSLLLGCCAHIAQAEREPVLPPFEFVASERAETASVVLRQLRFQGNQVVPTENLQIIFQVLPNFSYTFVLEDGF